MKATMEAAMTATMKATINATTITATIPTMKPLNPEAMMSEFEISLLSDPQIDTNQFYDRWIWRVSLSYSLAWFAD
jgi:hypothetical protein